MDILGNLMNSLGGDGMKKISGMLGTDEKTAGAATGTAVTALLGALSRNATSKKGAEELSKALAKDHDGSIFNNIPAHLSNPDAARGDGILKHALGAKQRRVETGLSQATGLDGARSNQLLKMLAPLVMGQLGKQQRAGGFDAQRMAGFLGQERQSLEKAQPQSAGIVGKLLDTDGDGDVDLSDLLGKGSDLLGGKAGGLLGKVFGK